MDQHRKWITPAQLSGRDANSHPPLHCF